MVEPLPTGDPPAEPVAAARLGEVHSYPYAPRPADPMPPGMAEEKWLAAHTPRWDGISGGALSLGALCFTVMLACLCVVPLTEVFDSRDWGAVFVFLSAGAMGGAGGLLSAWIAWGPQALGYRLLVAWFAAIVLFGAWLIGIQSTRQHLASDDLLWAFFSLPLLSLSIQLPLWVARVARGWRLVKGLATAGVGDRALTISDLMLATIIVAVSFAAARVARLDNATDEYWVAWGVVVAAVTGISLISIPVVAALVFRLPAARGFGLTLAYAILASCVAAFCMALYSQGRVQSLDVFYLGVVLCSMGGTLAWGALAARKLGYTLATSRRDV